MVTIFINLLFLIAFYYILKKYLSLWARTDIVLLKSKILQDFQNEKITKEEFLKSIDMVEFCEKNFKNYTFASLFENYVDLIIHFNKNVEFLKKDRAMAETHFAYLGRLSSILLKIHFGHNPLSTFVFINITILPVFCKEIFSKMKTVKFNYRYFRELALISVLLLVRADLTRNKSFEEFHGKVNYYCKST